MTYRLDGMRKTFKTEQDAREYAKAHWMDGTFRLYGGSQSKQDPDSLMIVAQIKYKTDRTCDPEMVCEFGLGTEMVSIYPFDVPKADLRAHGFKV